MGWRIGLLALLGAMQAGWLALWPLSVALTHSPPFTAAMLSRLPPLSVLPLTAPLGDPTYVGPTALLTITFALIGAAYLGALVLVSRRGAPLALILVSAVVFQVTLAALPGLFSQDVFSYIAYGRLSVTYDLNPYVWPPSAIAKDPTINWVADVWRTYPAPYGPLWLDVQWLMTRAFGALAVVDQALAYRALANALLLVNLGLLWRLVRHRAPAERAVALAVLAWNPLVLFEAGANAHNDALMVTFSLLAVLALAHRRETGAVAGFALGAVVKYLSALGILWLGLAELARDAAWRTRIVRLAVFGALTAAVVLVTFAPWLELPDSVEPLLNETAGVGYVNAIPDNLAIALAGAMQVSADAARAVERILVVLAFVAYLAWEARRVVQSPTPEAVLRATTRSLLVYILLVSTSVQTWYLCLPVALAAALGWRAWLSRVVLGYSVLVLPALYAHYYLRDLTPVWIDVVYGGLPLVWLAAMRLRAGARSQEPAAIGVGHDDHRSERHGLTGAVVEELRG